MYLFKFTHLDPMENFSWSNSLRRTEVQICSAAENQVEGDRVYIPRICIPWTRQLYLLNELSLVMMHSRIIK